MMQRKGPGVKNPSGALMRRWKRACPLLRKPRCQAIERSVPPERHGRRDIVRLYYVGLNTASESLERIQNRVRRGGHGIPQEDVLRRFDGRWEAVAKVLPYCDEAEFYDNDNGFVLVAEYRNGEPLLVGENPPAWILKLKDYLLDK